MGLDDPKLVSVHVAFDVWVCAIWPLSFKGGLLLLFYKYVRHLLSFNQSIDRGATAGLILSLTTDNMYIIMFPGFWMWYPIIHMQELLMIASVASVNSPSM